jgi:hypothetical protein
MGKTTIKFNYSAFGNLRRNVAVDAELKSKAYQIAARANAAAGLTDGYQVFAAASASRSRYIVAAVTEEARRMEATRRCLTNALTGE